MYDVYNVRISHSLYLWHEQDKALKQDTIPSNFTSLYASIPISTTRKTPQLSTMSSQTFQPHPAEVNSTKTVCQCGGADSTCGCARGQCTCAGCSKSSDPVNKAVPVEGSSRTVCKCGGNDSTCVSQPWIHGLETVLLTSIPQACKDGKCACSGCNKNH